ncbi:MAG: hypothetical protein K2X82_01295 [Gemmataceae bacterium]|nr:hypothetical protein [Gemmataceae bacterium]
MREPFAWRDPAFRPGEWVLPDPYGTDPDPRTRPEPGRFRPGRLLYRPAGPHELIPRGRGRHGAGRRCPGEGATIGPVEVTVRPLTRGMRYEVPPRDRRVDPSRRPTVPAGRFVIADARPA